MKTQNFTGIVLSRRLFMESDSIVSVLTEEGFKREFVAKGVQTGRSKRRAHLEPMNHIKGTFYEGRSQLYLQSVQSLCSFSKLKNELERIESAQVILEVLNKGIYDEDPHPALFSTLLDTLTQLNSEAPHPFAGESTLIRISHELGFLPSFKECHHCHLAIPKDEAHWNRENQWLSCSKCRRAQDQAFPLKFRKALEFFRSAPQSELQSLHIQNEEAHELKEFVSLFLLDHFGGRLKTLEGI